VRTATQYVELIVFPLQQWLTERANILRYTYIASLVKCYILGSLDAQNYVASMWEKKNAYRDLAGQPMVEQGRLERMGVHGVLILKWYLKK
jgi:hypothetical protein